MRATNKYYDLIMDWAKDSLKFSYAKCSERQKPLHNVIGTARMKKKEVKKHR